MCVARRRSACVSACLSNLLTYQPTAMVYFPTAPQLKFAFPSTNYVNSALEDTKKKAGEVLSSTGQVIDNTVKPSSKVALYSGEYYRYCALGGILACGPTHSLVTPLDLVKCRLQVDPKLYKGNFDGWKTIIRTEGASAIYTGFGATFIGYALQGGGKYGFYEVFKKKYSDLVGAEAATYKTAVYLAASASAEFLADIALCPFELAKVSVQTSLPPTYRGPFAEISAIAAAEGYRALYKGIVPLWLRQIPYTMVKFASFENIVEAIYGYLPKTKPEYSAAAQTGVSFTAGYLAGILCALVSHPADIMVSKISNEKKATESTGQAVSRIYARIGFGGLWTGLGTRIIMIGTLTGLQWLIYDSFKLYAGLPTTGSH